MKNTLTGLLLFIASFASSQEAFVFPDTITLLHECELGVFEDLIMTPAMLWYTYPNSHTLYDLGPYDEDPIWDGVYYKSCFAGSDFRGYYILSDVQAFVHLEIISVQVIIDYGEYLQTPPPACYDK